jgi:hypothetical protein
MRALGGVACGLSFCLVGCQAKREDPLERLVLNLPKTISSSDWKSWAKYLTPNDPSVTYLTPEQNLLLVSNMVLEMDDPVTLHHIPEKDVRTATSLKVHYKLRRNDKPYSDIDLKIVKNEKGIFQITGQQFCLPFYWGVEKDQAKRAILTAKALRAAGIKYMGREGRVLLPERFELLGEGKISFEELPLKEIPSGL